MRGVTLLIVSLMPWGLIADISVPQFLGDHMVLQRDADVPLWGWGEPGEAVVVSFAGQAIKAQVKPDGSWMLKLKPMAASSEGRTLTIGTREIRDVVTGEVWICSGQSNMQFRNRAMAPRCQHIGRPEQTPCQYTEASEQIACHAPLPYQDLQCRYQPTDSQRDR